MTKYNSHETPDQCTLWDQQHATRGVLLENSDAYKHTPNTSAVEFSRHLKPNSTILEFGSANGRDARYWADQGHNVYAVDFSQVALDQLKYIAMEQGVIEFVIPILHDISHGTLPIAGIPDSIDAFYARSALHIDDTQMYRLAFELNTVLKPGAKILIEGKGPNDKKNCSK